MAITFGVSFCGNILVKNSNGTVIQEIPTGLDFDQKALQKVEDSFEKKNCINLATRTISSLDASDPLSFTVLPNGLEIKADTKGQYQPSLELKDSNIDSSLLSKLQDCREKLLQKIVIAPQPLENLYNGVERSVQFLKSAILKENT